MNLPASVRIVEVGPRDGLQNESQFVDTATKIEFVQDLVRAGLKEIEVTSFVHPKWVPQLADAENLLSGLIPSEAVYSVLVPNMRGLERALSSGVKSVAIFTAASETFSQKNTNRSIEQSLIDFGPMVKVCRDAGILVRAYISTVFVCPYEGDVAPAASLTLAEALLEMGVDEISLGDTIGRAAPREVETVLQLLLPRVPSKKIAMHFHDTSGTALANVLLALQMGITCFDSSAGGLGGCPYAPGASGNLATEDLVYMLERMGVSTGVSLERLKVASRKIGSFLHKELPARQLRG